MGRGIPVRILVVEWLVGTFDYNVTGRLWSSTRLSNLCTERVSFKWQSHIGSFNPLRFVSLKGNTPNFQGGNNIDAWTSEKKSYGLHTLVFEAHVCTLHNRPFDTHVA